MAVRHITTGQSEDCKKLAAALYDSWMNDSAVDEEPIITIEGKDDKSPQHIYVVWEAWQHLNSRQRSEIIMEVAEKIYGTETSLFITVAMGLTRQEARNLNMDKTLGIA